MGIAIKRITEPSTMELKSKNKKGMSAADRIMGK